MDDGVILKEGPSICLEQTANPPLRRLLDGQIVAKKSGWQRDLKSKEESHRGTHLSGVDTMRQLAAKNSKCNILFITYADPHMHRDTQIQLHVFSPALGSCAAQRVC